MLTMKHRRGEAIHHSHFPSLRHFRVWFTSCSRRHLTSPTALLPRPLCCALATPSFGTAAHAAYEKNTSERRRGFPRQSPRARARFTSSPPSRLDLPAHSSSTPVRKSAGRNGREGAFLLAVVCPCLRMLLLDVVPAGACATLCYCLLVLSIVFAAYICAVVLESSCTSVRCR